MRVLDNIFSKFSVDLFLSTISVRGTKSLDKDRNWEWRCCLMASCAEGFSSFCSESKANREDTTAFLTTHKKTEQILRIFSHEKRSYIAKNLNHLSIKIDSFHQLHFYMVT